MRQVLKHDSISNTNANTAKWTFSAACGSNLRNHINKPICHHYLHPFTLILRQSLTKLPIQVLILPSSYLSLHCTWNDRPIVNCSGLLNGPEKWWKKGSCWSKTTKSQMEKCFQIPAITEWLLSEAMCFVLQNTPKSAFQKQVCGCKPAIPSHRKLRLKDFRFEASQSYIVRTLHQKIIEQWKQSTFQIVLLLFKES